MALVNVYQISVLESLTGSFGVNDTITIQVDDVTFDFFVTWYDFSAATSYTITSSSAQASWWLPATGVKNGITYIQQVFYDPLLCDVYAKVSFRRITQGYPWAEKILEDGHNACALNPAVCDLVFYGVSSVTSATDQTSLDGAFAVLATSTNTPIQYKIGSDFIYNDGTAQFSNTFTGLRAGIYSVWARDSKNCRAFTYVEVKAASLAHVVRYRIEFDDFKDPRTYHRVDILEKGYSGAIETKDCADNVPLSISLRGEGGNDTDRFPAIETYEVVSSWIATVEDEYEFLFTSEPNKYQLAYYDSSDDITYTLRWIGNVITDVYDEQHAAPPYQIQITATDGLSQLSEVDFINNSTGQLYTGSLKQIEVLAECLKNTGLELPIVSAINIFPTSHVVTATSDPLNLCYVDTQVYLKIEDDGNTVVPDKCNVVIKKILEPYGATLRQYNGKWHIYRREDLTKTSIPVREFTANGVYSSNTTWTPIQDVDAVEQPGTWHFMDGVLRQLAPGYGKVSINYDMGLQDNLIKNGDFKLKQVYNPLIGLSFPELDTDGFQLVSNGASSSLTYEVKGRDVSLGINNGLGLSYILFDSFTLNSNGSDKMRLTIRYKLRSDFVPTSVGWQKLKVQVKYDTVYLLSTGEWTTTENFVIHYESEVANYKDLVFEFFPPPLVTTGTFTVKVFSSYYFDAEFTSYANMRNKATATLPPGVRTELLLAGVVDWMYFYELENNTDAESVPDIVRPNDYNAGTNPYQWILKGRIAKNEYEAYNPPPTTWFSKVQLQYLPNQVEDIRVKTVTINTNRGVSRVFEKDIFHGSAVQFYTPGGRGFVFTPDLTFGAIDISGAFTRNYIGYLRDSNGVEFRNFARVDIDEAALLENILAAAYAGQLSRAARILMCGVYTRDAKWELLNALRVQSDGDKIYCPVSYDWNVKTNVVNGIQMFEIREALPADDVTGSGINPFTSGFSIGFGNGYN